MTNKIIFDNGSVGSKLLQKELNDAEVVKVSGNNLVESFTKFDASKQDNRIYLPFTVEELAENNEQLRKDIQAVEVRGFKNQIVLPYEGDTKKTIEYRAKAAGIGDNFKVKDQVPEGAGVIRDDETTKPYKTVRPGSI